MLCNNSKNGEQFSYYLNYDLCYQGCQLVIYWLWPEAKARPSQAKPKCWPDFLKSQSQRPEPKCPISAQISTAYDIMVVRE